MVDRRKPDRDATRSNYPRASVRQKKRRSLGALLAYVFFAVFVLGGIYMGCIFVTSIASMLQLGPVTVALPRPPAPGLPGAASEAPAWKGTERINILLMGLDQRENERGQPTRSDTLIVLTIDPATKSAGMLSLPRDLWVTIPGHGENKINTGYFFGEVDKKGNGPSLAMRTVQTFLDIPIHHYAVVDFLGFEKLIDAIGGVTIDVEKPLKDDEYPTPDYGYMRIYVPAGIQHMTGERALQYARSRHADNDLGRNKRQQQVILAARSQVMKLDIIPKLPTMLGILQQALQTDFSPGDILALARLSRDIDSKNVVSRSVDVSMINDVYGDGSILTVKRPELAKAMAEIFSDPRLRNESANIEVQNGSDRAGLANSTATSLKNLGYKVLKVGNAERSDYKESVVIDYTGKKTTANSLAQLLGISLKNVKSASASPKDKDSIDILIILGPEAKIP